MDGREGRGGGAEGRAGGRGEGWSGGRGSGSAGLCETKVEALDGAGGRVDGLVVELGVFVAQVAVV